MRRGSLFILGLTLIFLLSSGYVFADESTRQIETRVIEAFNGSVEYEWRAFGSKFVTEGYPQAVYAEGIFPDDLYGRNDADEEGIGSFGIHAKFDRMGYNYVEMVPGKQDESGEWLATPLEIPGRVSVIDFWVWGSNYNYYLELYLMDSNGYVHKLLVDDLNYIGWKNLSVNVPTSIPQARTYVPRYAGLSITKIVLWTRPGVPVDDFYLYIDDIKVLTDLHETRFDGYELADPDTLNEIWGGTE